MHAAALLDAPAHRRRHHCTANWLARGITRRVELRPFTENLAPHDVEHWVPARNTENTHAIGIQITFGEFRLVDLADLTDDREFDLMCPDNLIGRADLFMVSHHGQSRANSKALVHAIESRVAIMNNGIKKGGQPEVMSVIHSAPGLEDLWQLHASQLSGQEFTSPGLFIANPAVSPPVHDGPAYWIKVSAQHDGAFAVTNSRNGFEKTYRSRGR